MFNFGYRKAYGDMKRGILAGLDMPISKKDKYYKEKVKMNKDAKEFFTASKNNEREVIRRIMKSFIKQLEGMGYPSTYQNMRGFFKPELLVAYARNTVPAIKLEHMIKKAPEKTPELIALEQVLNEQKKD